MLSVMNDNVSGIVDISVLMSVYSKSHPKYLDEAIESIWTNQISKPKQICIVSDGPLSEQLDAVLNKWSEILGDRLTRVKLASHCGLAVALNKGIAHCNSQIIARMDADDVSWPERFATQYAFMQQHPEIDVLGTQVEEKDDELKNLLGYRFVPLTQKEILEFAKLRSPFNHPSVMYRKKSVESVGKYPVLYPEDYPLWGLMLLKGCQFANLPEILVTMRSSSAYKYRRGLQFFLAELRVENFLYLQGFLNFRQYLKSLLFRLLYRLSPSYLKILFKHCYSYFVSKK